MGTTPQGFKDSVQHYLNRLQTGVVATGMAATLAVVPASTVLQLGPINACGFPAAVRATRPIGFPTHI